MGEQTFLIKTQGKTFLFVSLLAGRTSFLAAGRLGDLAHSFPGKSCPLPPPSCCCPVPGEISSSELQRTGLTGKLKGFPGVFGSRPLTFWDDAKVQLFLCLLAQQP